jgi:hypothetical protein
VACRRGQYTVVSAEELRRRRLSAARDRHARALRELDALTADLGAAVATYRELGVDLTMLRADPPGPHSVQGVKGGPTETGAPEDSATEHAQAANLIMEEQPLPNTVQELLSLLPACSNFLRSRNVRDVYLAAPHAVDVGLRSTLDRGRHRKRRHVRSSNESRWEESLVTSDPYWPCVSGHLHESLLDFVRGEGARLEFHMYRRSRPSKRWRACSRSSGEAPL